MRLLNSAGLVAIAKQWLVQWNAIQGLLEAIKQGGSRWDAAMITLLRECAQLNGWCEAVVQEQQRLLGKEPETHKLPTQLAKNHQKRDGYSRIAALNVGEYWIICLSQLHRVNNTLLTLKSWKGLSAAQSIQLLRCRRKFNGFIKSHQLSIEPVLILQLMRQCVTARYGEELVDDIVHGTGEAGFFIGDPRNQLDHGLVDQAYALGRRVI